VQQENTPVSDSARRSDIQKSMTDKRHMVLVL